ncbi:MAG TPA: hypothetical protein VIG99_29165 [Myxococcaceae bacterium]|jgi:hypothetical protein
MRREPLTVLGAGPGLGFYVPAAILARRASRRRPVELLAIESLLPPEKQSVIERSRLAFHRSFDVARMGQRMVKDITGDLDAAAVDALLARWRAEERRDFVVFSGFWAPLVARFARERRGLRVAHCHVDCVPSSSWSLVSEGEARGVWFVRWEGRALNHRLEVSGRAPLSWVERSGRLLAHGGGWGIGTYRDRIRALESSGWSLDVLAYEPGDAAQFPPGARAFMPDPGWVPWKAGSDWFPPLGQVEPGQSIRYTRSAEYPPLFDLTRTAAAVISKPGGGTLIDSLAAATPLLLIEPFGDYERKNGELWKELGFAIDLADWIADGCRHGVLESLHHNLLGAYEYTPAYEGWAP